MRRALPYLAAALLGSAAAVASGCGDRSNLVPSDAAADMRGRLAEAKTAIAAGQCAAAKAAVDGAFDAAKGLDAEVDRRLRARINEGFRTLEDNYDEACKAAQQQTETEPEPTQTTATTETTTTETTPTDTTTTEEPSTSTPSTSEPTSAEPPTTTEPGTGGTPEETPTP